MLNLWKSLKTPFKVIVVGLVIFILAGVYFFIQDRIEMSNQGHEISNLRAKVNLEPDIGFLDCVRIQHACLYDHVRKSQFNTIVEDCKDENFCNNIFK